MAAAVVVVVLSSFAAAQVLIPVPRLSGASAGVPVASVAPLVILVAVLYSLGLIRPEYEVVAVRPTAVFDAGGIAGVGVVTALVLTTGASVADAPDLLVLAARNVLGFIGLGLLVAAVAGTRLAAVAVTGYLLVCTTFGSSGDRTKFWAWPIETHSSVRTTALVVSLFVAGLVASCLAFPIARRGFRPGGER